LSNRSPTYPKTGAIISNSPNGLIHHLGTEWLVFAHQQNCGRLRKQPAGCTPPQLAGIQANPLSNRSPATIPKDGFNPPAAPTDLIHHLAGMARVCSHQQRCGRLRKQAKPVPRLHNWGFNFLCQTGPPTYPKTGAIISSSPNGLDPPLGRAGMARVCSHQQGRGRL
jgi:hypothetical protein